MESIKISVEVSVNLSENTQNFIKSLFAATVSKAAVPKVKQTTVPVAPETKQTIVPVAPETKQTIVPAPVEAKPVEAKPVEAKPVESSAPAVSIEDVRQELVKKVNAHREEIKAKLTEFGAPSVTKLDSSKYEAMYNFLTSL